MSDVTRSQLVAFRVALPFVVAVLIGVFLAVASHQLNWSGTTIVVVGSALVGVLALFGVPIVVLSLDSTDHADDARDAGVSSQSIASYATPRVARESRSRRIYVIPERTPAYALHDVIGGALIRDSQTVSSNPSSRAFLALSSPAVNWSDLNEFMTRRVDAMYTPYLPPHETDLVE